MYKLVILVTVSLVLISCNNDKSTNLGSNSNRITKSFGEASFYYQNGQELCWETTDNISDTMFYSYDENHRVQYAFVDTLIYNKQKPAYKRFLYDDQGRLSSELTLTYKSNLNEIDSLVSNIDYTYTDSGRLFEETTVIQFDNGTGTFITRYVEWEDGRIASYDQNRMRNENLPYNEYYCNDVFIYDELDMLLSSYSCSIRNGVVYSRTYDINGYISNTMRGDSITATWNKEYNAQNNIIHANPDKQGVVPFEKYLNWASDCPEFEVPQSLIEFELPEVIHSTTKIAR
jgi:hypothetical protein